MPFISCLTLDTAHNTEGIVIYWVLLVSSCMSVDWHEKEKVSSRGQDLTLTVGQGNQSAR